MGLRSLFLISFSREAPSHMFRLLPRRSFVAALLFAFSVALLPGSATAEAGDVRADPVADSSRMGDPDSVRNLAQAASPEAIVQTSDRRGVAPLQVSLEGDASEGAGLDYSWTVSQNQVSTASAFDYTFSKPGLHRVVLTVEDEQGQTDSETLFVSVLPPLPSVSTYGEGVDELAVELDSLNSAILRMIEAATDGYSSSEISIDESNAGRVFAAIQHAQAYNARFLLIESQVDSLAEASGSAGAQSAMLSTANAPSDDEGIGFKVLNEMTSGVAKFFSSAFSLQSGRVEDFAPMVLETLRNPSAYPDSYEALGDRPDPVTSVADWQALSTNEKRWKVERLRGTLFCVEWQSACRENDQKFAEDLGKTAVEGGKMSVELGTSAAGLDDPKLDVVKEVTRAQGSNVPETVIEVAYETAQASFGTVKQNVTETVDKLLERTQPDSDSPTVDASNAKQYLRRFIRQANQVEHNTLGQVIDVQLNDALDRFPELGFRDADGNVVMHVPEKSHIGESTRSGTYKTFADKVQIGAVTDQVVAYFNEVRNPDTDASYPLNPSAADATADVQTGATTSTNPYSSEPTYVRGEISTSTWSKYGSPYVIEDEVRVYDDATLTVEAGAVVKFQTDATPDDDSDDRGKLYSYSGTLNVEGTAQDSVVFTSLKDDTYGGDTNGDGDETAPAPGDWKHVPFRGGAVEHAVVRYGERMFNIDAGSPTITDSRFERSADAGILVSEGYDDAESAPTVEASVFADNEQEGIHVHNAGGTVTGNRFVGNGAAVNIDQSSGQGSPAPTASDNTIENNGVGVSLSGSAAPSLGTASDYGRNVFRNNDDFAIRNNSDETVQAVGNYWNATTASAIEERLSGPVAFEPFLGEEPSDPQTIAVKAGETGKVALGETGAAVSIMENDDPDGGELRFRRHSTPPPDNAFGGSATAPDGSTVRPDTTAGRYWTISSEDLTDIAFKVRLSAAGVGDIGLPRQLLVLKRPGPDLVWMPLSTTRDGDVLVSSRLDSFSQFILGGNPASSAPATAPSLEAPPAGTTDVAPAPTLSWAGVDQGRRYRGEVSTQEDFPSGATQTYVTPETETPTDSLTRGTTYHWRVRAENSLGESRWSSVRSFTTRAASLRRSVAVSSGWNMAGMPVEPGGPSPKSLGAALPSGCGSLFRWDPGQGSYQEFGSGEALPAGGGAWTFCESSGTATVEAPPASDKTVSVESGWNQVGPFEEAIAPSAVGQDPSGLIEGAWYRWDPGQGSYAQPSELEPGVGYWVFATEDGTLDFSGGGAKAAGDRSRRPGETGGGLSAGGDRRGRPRPEAVPRPRADREGAGPLAAATGRAGWRVCRPFRGGLSGRGGRERGRG
jgi:hypothetical protein